MVQCWDVGLCMEQSSGNAVLHSDLLGNEGGVWKVQLHSFSTCSTVLVAGIVPWDWIPGGNDWLCLWIQAVLHAPQQCGLAPSAAVGPGGPRCMIRK